MKDLFMRDVKKEIACCPDCGQCLQFGSGCWFCPVCGYSPCKGLIMTVGGFGLMLSCLILMVMS